MPFDTEPIVKPGLFAVIIYVPRKGVAGYNFLMMEWLISKLDVNMLRALVPKACHACGGREYGQDRKPLCAKCTSKIIMPPINTCSVCGRPLEFDYEIDTQESYMCHDCLEKPPLYERNIHALGYGGPVRELIHKFKFQSQPYLAKTLAMTGREVLEPWFAQQGDAVIIPVPLARQKLFERGYNHAYLLAVHFARWGEMELSEGNLQRIRNTQPQFGLKPDQRKKNVRGAFAVRDPRAIKGRTIILLDDIFTTGATIEECCKVVMKAKPKEILVACLCRARFD